MNIYHLAGLLAYFWSVVYALYRKLTEDGMSEHELGIFVVGVNNSNNVSDNRFGKEAPPNYTEIVLDPPTPDYEGICNLKFQKDKESGNAY